MTLGLRTVINPVDDPAAAQAGYRQVQGQGPTSTSLFEKSLCKPGEVR